ncbi:MAG: GNAT family N-acetyltransferase, partial [Bacteroidales bacterium]|nr:GNAT family N-acetyltransferase [Bacteroidales bacterium]
MSNLLENNIIKLRAIEPEDLELLYKWENNSENWQFSNTLVPYSKYILKQYIENSNKDIFETKQLRLIIINKIDNSAIGTIDLFDIDFYNLKAGIGILIADSENRKKGYAGISLEIIINYSFKYLGLNQLYCEISEKNTSSLKLFQNLHFLISGKLISWKKTSETFENVFFL